MSPKVVISFWLLAGLFHAEPGAWAAVGFTRGPFVQNATTNSIQIIWRTSKPASGFVEYGPTNGPLLLVTNAVLETNHVVTLTDLAPARPTNTAWAANARRGL
jgi:hypothetical protein